MEAHSVPRSAGLSLPRSRRLLAPLGDERLVDQVRRGNDAAFEAIYDRHHRGILAFCRHMLACPDEAEDAVQHTFIQAYDSIRRGGQELKLRAWLYAIARNRCISILRGRREQATELDDIPTVGLSEEVQQRSDLRDLLADIHELPVEQRAALVLSELGDLSHPEIASVVGCEVTKVKALVFQARTSLAETRKARSIPCHTIREQLATASGGVLRRGPLRRHLKQCEGCAEFRDEVRRQRSMLAIALPVVPSMALKKTALAAIGLGGGGGAATTGGVAAGGGLASLVGSTGASKAIAVVALAGATVGGGVAIGERASSGGASKQAAPATPAAHDRGVGASATPAHTRSASTRSAPHRAAHHRSAAPAKPRAHHVAGAPAPGRQQAQSNPSKGGNGNGNGNGRSNAHHSNPHANTAPSAPSPVAPGPPADTPGKGPKNNPPSSDSNGNHRGHEYNTPTAPPGHQDAQHEQHLPPGISKPGKVK